MENEKKYEDHPADDVLPGSDFDAEGAESSEPGHHSENEKTCAESEAPESLHTTDTAFPPLLPVMIRQTLMPNC